MTLEQLGISIKDIIYLAFFERNKPLTRGGNK